MKVCLVSDFAQTGGAAIASDRIARALHQAGCNIHRISSNAPARSMFQEYSLHESRKLQLLMTLSGGKFLRLYITKKRKRDLLHQLRKTLATIKPDFVSLHNIHGTDWPIELAEVALDQCPTCWTLHDCSSFLGSYYPKYCEQATEHSLQRLEKFWGRISSHKSKKQFSFVAPSNWMHTSAKSSYWRDYRSSWIPYPIFDEYNSRSEQESCKKALGLDQNQITILFVAGNLSEDRKGGFILREILTSENLSHVQFLLLGSVDSKLKFPPNVRSMGFIEDDELKRIAYASADIMLHPAPIDNLPNTVIESIACGTPVLAFSAGGLSDMVVPDKSGWLVEKIDSDSMISELNKIITTRSYKNIKFQLTEITERMFSPSKIAGDYTRHLKSPYE